MKQPKTIEDAMALNEITSLIVGGNLPSIFFGSAGIAGDTICSFVDADGRSKRVECIRRTSDGENEWVKIPM